MKALSKQQKHDILNSLNRIKEDIQKLQDTTVLTDGELLYFYEELKTKADFGYNFVKCAQIVASMLAKEHIKIK